MPSPLTPVFETSAEEFYVLADGKSLARIVMAPKGGVSHVVVSREMSEGINNRALMQVIDGDAIRITPQDYLTRKAVIDARRSSVSLSLQ